MVTSSPTVCRVSSYSQFSFSSSPLACPAHCTVRVCAVGVTAGGVVGVAGGSELSRAVSMQRLDDVERVREQQVVTRSSKDGATVDGRGQW